MVKNSVLFFLGILLAISFVCAVDTDIHVKTLPYHEVQIAFSQSGTANYVLIEKFKQYSTHDGDASFVFSSDVDKFDLTIYIKNMTGGDVSGLQPYRETGVPAGEDVDLTLFPKGYVPEEEPEDSSAALESNADAAEISNESVNPGEQAEVISEAVRENTTSFFSGFVVFGKEALTNKTTYYTFGGFLVIMLFAVGFFMLRKKERVPKEEREKEIKVRKLSELQAEKEQKSKDESDEAKEIESKIKELQGRLDNLTKEEKIKEAKKKLEDAEKEILRLRGGN